MNEMSYVNLIMYGSVLPSYNPKGDKGKRNDEHINADDPRNREKVNKILFGSIE